MRPRLRIFNGPETTSTVAEPEVTVKLGELSQIIAEAVRTQRAWVDDFSDDEIRVSPDLYEILSAYWHLRPSA